MTEEKKPPFGAPIAANIAAHEAAKKAAGAKKTVGFSEPPPAKPEEPELNVRPFSEVIAELSEEGDELRVESEEKPEVSATGSVAVDVSELGKSPTTIQPTTTPVGSPVPPLPVPPAEVDRLTLVLDPSRTRVGENVKVLVMAVLKDGKSRDVTAFCQINHDPASSGSFTGNIFSPTEKAHVNIGALYGTSEDNKVGLATLTVLPNVVTPAPRVSTGMVTSVAPVTATAPSASTGPIATPSAPVAPAPAAPAPKRTPARVVGTPALTPKREIALAAAKAAAEVREREALKIEAEVKHAIDLAAAAAKAEAETRAREQMTIEAAAKNAFDAAKAEVDKRVEAALADEAKARAEREKAAAKKAAEDEERQKRIASWHQWRPYIAAAGVGLLALIYIAMMFPSGGVAETPTPAPVAPVAVTPDAGPADAGPSPTPARDAGSASGGDASASATMRCTPVPSSCGTCGYTCAPVP